MSERPPAQTLTDMHEMAVRFECDLIVGTPTTLLLDLDGAPAIEHFSRMWPYFSALFECQVTDRYISRHGHGHHIVVQLSQGISKSERASWQAFLGSDPRHVLLWLDTDICPSCQTEAPLVLFKPRTPWTVQTLPEGGTPL